MIGYIRPDGFAAIPHPARRPDGGRVRQSLSSQKTPYKFRHLSPGLWGELVSDNFMISIDAIAHGLSLSVP